MSKKVYDIAVLKGDGIGPEVVEEALVVLQAIGTPRFNFTGASLWCRLLFRLWRALTRCDG